MTTNAVTRARIRVRMPSFQRHIEPALFSLLTTSQALIVLFSARPPLRDAPLYEATFTLLSQPSGTRMWFASDLVGSQGSLVFAIGTQLARVFAPQTVFQLLMAFGVLSLPWAFRTLCLAMGRGVMASWIAAPLAFHAGLFCGELRMTLALPLTLAFVASTLSLSKGGSRLREVALVVSSTALFFSHAGLWLLAYALGWLALLVPGPVSLLIRARSLVSSGALVAIAAVFLDLTWLKTFDDDFRFLLADCEPAVRLKDFGLFTTYTLSGESADRISKAWVGLIALSVSLTLTAFSPLSAQARNVRLYAASCAGISFLAFILTPVDFDAMWGWGLAFSGLCALLLLAALPLPSGRIRAVLLVGFMLLAAWRAFQVSDAFFAFRTQEVADFDEALQVVPKRRHLLVLISDPHSTFVHPQAFFNYGAFYQILSPQGLVAPIIGDLPGWPLALREDASRPPLLEQRTLLATGYVYPATLEWADFVLTRGSWRNRPEDRAKLIHQGAEWSVYRIMPLEESFRARKPAPDAVQPSTSPSETVTEPTKSPRPTDPFDVAQPFDMTEPP